MHNKLSRYFQSTEDIVIIIIIMIIIIITLTIRWLVTFTGRYVNIWGYRLLTNTKNIYMKES